MARSVSDSTAPPTPTFSALPLAQREVALLLALCVAACVMFVTTRTLANWSRHQRVLEAAEWYQRGESALEAGRADQGLDALRRAVAADRASVPYALALARGLARTGRDDEAWQILQRLRGDQPEDAEVNYRLARLADRRADLQAAVRYYHNAMYGIESTDPQVGRRAIALELAGVLLDHGDRDRALAELIALASDLSDAMPDQLPLARLLLKAGDAPRALTHFLAAASAGADSALAGAGDAAMEDHDFPAAERYWRDAARKGADVATRLHLVRLVLSADPLATRINSLERSRRVREGLRLAADRLLTCPASTLTASGGGETADELAHFRSEHTGSGLRETEVLESGIGLIARVRADVTRRCGPDVDPAVDEAWRQMAAAHRSGPS